MDFDQVIQKRRSIRKYKQKDIPENVVKKLLSVAQTAPSRTNVQPWRFIVTRDQDVKDQLAVAAYNQGIVSKAPLVISVFGDLSAWGTVPDRTSELVEAGCFGMDVKNAADKVLVGKQMTELSISTAKNATIAATMLMLACVNEGLGTCWVKLMKDDEINKVLNVPPHYICVGVFPVGYPDESPKARPRLPLKELVYKDVYGKKYYK
jgi:nitroreductase